MAISKVVFGGDTLMDITDSTVSEDSLLDGFTAYGADGEKVVGGVKLATKLSELENDAGYVTGDIIKVSSDEPDSEETKVWIKDSDNEEIELLTPEDLVGYAKTSDIPELNNIVLTYGSTDISFNDVVSNIDSGKEVIVIRNSGNSRYTYQNAFLNESRTQVTFTMLYGDKYYYVAYKTGDVWSLGSNANKYAMISDIPTKLSDLNNDLEEEFKIIFHPISQSLNEGDYAVFSCIAVGAVSYQWQYKTKSANSWVNSTTEGANTSSVTIQGTASRNGQRYRCIVTDKNENQLISEEASIIINSAVDYYTKTEIDNKGYLTLDTLPKYNGGVR